MDINKVKVFLENIGIKLVINKNPNKKEIERVLKKIKENENIRNINILR